MHKLRLLYIVLIIGVGSLAWAQESFVYESDHYSVRSFVSDSHAQAVAVRLESYLTEFNNYFHFDLEKLGLKLKVRIFESKERFDTYVKRLINETRDDYVYLHYSDQARSELVGYEDANAPVPEASIAHQGFIQFLRAYVNNPPLWLREGFAVYFEELVFDSETGTSSIKENLSWLETLKELTTGSRSAEAIALTDLLGLTVDQAREKINVFYPQAWSLVHYLARSDVKAHNRILWDAISALSKTATLEENSTAVAERALKWVDSTSLQESYTAYFTAKKTYRELVQEGIDSYAAGKVAEAEAVFTQAAGLQEANFVPYYYLGLINYDKGNFSNAETFYAVALEKGANPALTNYALGVNAFADNRFEVAKVFLQKTIELDASFREKVTELIERMES